jgi:hypothetical protein
MVLAEDSGENGPSVLDLILRGNDPVDPGHALALAVDRLRKLKGS